MSKTASFAAVHFSVAFSVAYLISGNPLVGGAIALIEPAINTVAYHFHERVWNRIRDLRRDIPLDAATTV
ncbi:MAG TPA: DUF2061 domain-containing protein [Gammaproteobacteria bacterium]|nr:DUF2061 domain-containing protein [Gammaproteobacteria bacterium]